MLAVGTGVRAARREREAYGRAERAGLASRMAAMVAHEVRNPLGIIRAGAELLRERSQSSPSACADHELIDDILGEVKRLNAITEDFLALARETTLRVESVDVRSLCEEVSAKVRLRFPRLSIEVAAAGAGAALGEEARLRQVLLNLVMNAAEATSGSGRVRVEGAPEGSAVRLSVIDDGPGVDAAAAARLFEPFSTSKPGGTGLGLALARKIVEEHGGTLQMRPVPSGARFDILLPSAPPRVATAAV
jgi:signal transduction histidine kinase